MSKPLMIGDLARRTGTKVNTIRFYEELGLLPKAVRTAAGRRTYGEDGVRRLAFIRHARRLGFSTAEIRSLLDLTDHPEQDCAKATVIAEGHLSDVRGRIKQLRTLQRELEHMVSECGSGRSVADCRILEALGELHSAK